MNNEFENLREEIQKLRNDVDELSAAFYKNNFLSTQVFNKDSIFTTKLKVPTYTVLPNCEVGEIAEVAGELYICSATNTWTVVGTQT